MSDEHRPRVRRHILVVANPNPTDGDIADRNPTVPVGRYPSQQAATSKAHTHTPHPLDTTLRVNPSYSHTNLVPSLSSPSSTSSPAVESPPPPVTPGLPASVVEPSLDARSRSQLDLPSTSSSSLRSESSTIQRLPDLFGIIGKRTKHTHRPKTSPTTATKPTISMEPWSTFTTYKPLFTLPGKVVLQATSDDDTYSNVEISGVTDGCVIREKIYSKLKIPDEEYAFNSIHRTHIGTTGFGDPLSDDMLFKICREEGDPHASLKFFVRRRFSPANYSNMDPVSPSVNNVPTPIFDPVPISDHTPTLIYSQPPRVVPPLRPRKLRTNSRRGSVSSAASDRKHADGGAEYDASVSDGLEPDRETYRPAPRAPAPLPSPGMYQPNSPSGYLPRPPLPQPSSYFPSPPRDSSPDRPRRMPTSKSSLSQVSKQSPINDYTPRQHHREQPHHRSSSDNNVNADDRNNKGQTTLDTSTDYAPKAGRRTKDARSPQTIPRSESGEDPAGWVFVSSEGSSTLTARDSPVDMSRPTEIRKNTGLENQVSGSPNHPRPSRPLVPPAPTVNAPRPVMKQVSPSILDPSRFASPMASKSTSAKTKSTPNLHDLFVSGSHHSSSSISSQHPTNLLPGTKGYYANNIPSTRPSLPTLTDSSHDSTPTPEYTNKPSVVGSTYPHPLPRIPTEPPPTNSRTTTEPISISGHSQLRHNSREHLYSPTGPISSSYHSPSSLSNHSNAITHGPRPRHHAGGGALSEDDARPHGHTFSPTDLHDGGPMAATPPQKPILDPYSSSSLSNITINAPKPLPQSSSSSHISPPRSPTGPLPPPPPPPPPPPTAQHNNLLRPGTLTDSDTVISRNTSGTTVTRASDDSGATITQPAFPWFTQMMQDYEKEMRENASATPPPPPPLPPSMSHQQQQEKTKDQQQQEVGGGQGGALGALASYGGLSQTSAPVTAKPPSSRPIRRLPDPQSTLLSSSLSSSSTNLNSSSNSSTLIGNSFIGTAGGTGGTSTIAFPPQLPNKVRNNDDDGHDHDDDDDDDDDDGDLWQVKPLDTPSISARQAPPLLLVDTGLYPNRPAPPPPHQQQHDVLGNRSGLRRNADHRKSKFETADERPPPEDVINQLEDFFPGHDLDKPVIEAALGGSSPTNVEPPVSLPAPSSSSSASNMSVSSTASSGSASATLLPSSHPYSSSASSSTLMDRDSKERSRGSRMKMSIRRVAKEGQKRIDRTSRYEPSTSSMSSSMFRKRSTKLWGSKLEEVWTAMEHKPSTLAVPESPSGEPKPIFKWVRGELIGKGTYGRVYLALNATTGEMIAVKQVEIPRTSADKADGKQVTVVEALKSESETLKDLDHPNIVQYLGFEETPRYLSIFLEYVPGGSVGSCLRKYGKFDESVTKSFTAQILAGLEYLHSRGVIHRDLKADNILVEATGICKISDFGISKRTDDDNQNGHTAMRGSVFWMAPEVIKPNAEGYTSKVDIWSVGCVVLEMWAGERPWSEDEMIPVMVKLYTSKAPPPIPSGVFLSNQAVDFRNLCFATDPNDRPTAAMLRRHEYLFLPDGWTFTCFSSAMHL